MDVPKSPCSPQNEYSPSAEQWPLSSVDGSLIIDADGRVGRATPEQQWRAIEARAAGAAKADKYRKKAAACRLEAENAEVEENRLKWLEVAQRWENSAEKVEATRNSEAAADIEGA